MEISGHFSQYYKQEIAKKKSKFPEQQIIFALHQSVTGVKVSEVCRKMGIREATFFK